MKRSFKFLATIIALTFFASSCQEDVESPGQLSEVDILAVDIKKYEKISLINAMLDLGEINISIENILN